jgi:hypothetical protein
MDIKQATKAYEAWLAKRIPLIAADLRLRHQRMAESPFPFLRATFYRWAQVWPEVCPEVANAPKVLGVGDLHVENFGTWRDCEGRLIWGVNDFDEVTEMPYTNDLVRLAVSAQLAIRENHLTSAPEDACNAILTGYEHGMKKGGGPFVLAEKHEWLREMALSIMRDPVAFWAKLEALPTIKGNLPSQVNALLKRAFPDPKVKCRVVHRQAGLGSLGRRRFTALAEWRGGMLAREAKELRTSAWNWFTPKQNSSRLFYGEAISKALRVPDPFLSVHGQWLVRRLAPDCSRVELASLPKSKDELKILHAMGWETANIHLGTKAARSGIGRDLAKRPRKWLRKATDGMTKAVLADWKQWTAA